MSANYSIITPVRNEAQFLGATIDSVVAQTIRPQVWYLVNDGSSDETGQIIEAAASRYKWIRAIHRADRGSRKAGTGVMEAFYEAYASLENHSWEFLVKLDGDLSFKPDYFERCFSIFDAEPCLGIGSGLVCTPESRGCVAEFKDPSYHVRGPAKIYRRDCWSEIDGLVIAPGWDTLDLLKANMAGWTTRTFREITLVHHRPTGGAYGAWSTWKKNGFANYLLGYHPVFMLAKCASRALKKPFGIAALGLLCGFSIGYWNRTARVADQVVIRYLRQQQVRCLFGRPSLWRPERTRE